MSRNAVSGVRLVEPLLDEAVNIPKWKSWLLGLARGNTKAASAGRGHSRAVDKVFSALVMLVDDEPLAIEVTRVHLEEAGFTRFVATSNPAQALELMMEKRPDVLLLDLMMPGTSGFDILSHMEAQNILKDIPTIVLTAATDTQSRVQALELGVTEFLMKPADPIELVMRVSNTLAAKAYWQGCWET